MGLPDISRDGITVDISRDGITVDISRDGIAVKKTVEWEKKKLWISQGM